MNKHLQYTCVTYTGHACALWWCPHSTSTSVTRCHKWVNSWTWRKLCALMWSDRLAMRLHWFTGSFWECILLIYVFFFFLDNFCKLIIILLLVIINSSFVFFFFYLLMSFGVKRNPSNKVASALHKIFVATLVSSMHFFARACTSETQKLIVNL